MGGSTSPTIKQKTYDWISGLVEAHTLKIYFKDLIGDLRSCSASGIFEQPRRPIRIPRALQHCFELKNVQLGGYGL